MPARRIVMLPSRLRDESEGMDIVAIVIAVAAFALLLALVESLDRV
jgi:hypothetical protein